MARRGGGKFNGNFRLTLDRESPVQSSSEIVDLAPKRPEPLRRIHGTALFEQIAKVESVAPTTVVLFIALGKSS
jgi:hypothetical protein